MRQLWVGLALCWLAPAGWAQVVDAAGIEEVRSPKAGWRFHQSDEAKDDAQAAARYADPGFDDSAWPLIAPGQSFAQAHESNGATGHSEWLRLRIDNAMRPLGMDLATTLSPPNQGAPFEVFANGQRIAVSPGWTRNAGSSLPPFVIALPRTQSIVIAVHFFKSTIQPAVQFPYYGFELGALSPVTTHTELERIRYFNDHVYSETGLTVLLLLIGAIALALFREQPERREYLGLALAAISFGLDGVLGCCIDSGLLSPTSIVLGLTGALGFPVIFFNVWFAMLFSQMRWRVSPWILFAFYAAAPVVILVSQSNTVAGVAFLLIFTLSIAWIGYCLIDAYRRRLAESGALLVAYGAFGVTFLMKFMGQAKLLPLSNQLHLGYLGLGVEDVGVFVLEMGILLVVLLRFVRVTREQKSSEAEFEAARTVQQVLIPEELPRIAGLTIESVYKPAQQVGGDFFQLIPVEDGAALVVMGDVAGKGMQAAMTVSLLVGAVRTEAEHTSSPALLMQALNRRSYGRGSSFTTCLILRVAQDGEVIAANAGHLQPYLDGREVELGGGLPLGFDAHAEYAETRFALATGERLTLITDGVVEAANMKKELFGFARTAAVSAKSAHAIAEEAQYFGAGAAQADDITVLTVVRA